MAALSLGALCLLSGTASASAGPFEDIPDSVFRADIEWATEAGITRGCNPPENDRFCPSSPVTRGEMAAFLHRAFSDHHRSLAAVEFADSSDSIFRADIEWAAEAGVTRGCNPPENDRFCPDDTVTRAQMAAFLVRVLHLAAGVAAFQDIQDHVFEADVARLATANITFGCNPPDNDRFCPDEPVTRAQMAGFLRRALEAGTWDHPGFRWLDMGGAGQVAFCGTGPLDGPSSVTELIVIVHGDSRNACDYATHMTSAAEAAGRRNGLLIVAPLFLTEQDADTSDGSLLLWSDDGWKSGRSALSPPEDHSGTPSSFSVVDRIIDVVKSHHPGIGEVVVAGHSAGGQFVNRYSFASEPRDHVRFVVANPSSYLYLDARRWNGVAFAEPSRSTCPTFNRWKYGLESVPPYLSPSDLADRLDAFPHRSVAYLLGEDDIARDSGLDISCAGELQGSNRLDRGLRYHGHLLSLLGSALEGNQAITVIKGVDHSARSIFTSSTGERSLFGD